jgi:hypothetical protein
VLANVLRTDRHAHRPLPAGSELAQAIAVLARAQQDAVWDRTTAHNRLRSHLREYYPGFLAAFEGARGGILRPQARTILAAAPTPADAARLSEDPLFADDAVARLHRAASGLPRALNNAGTAALMAAAAAGKDLVDDTCARKAVAELTRD